MAKSKILIVDDEEDICELLRFNLAREGYPIVIAGTGEQAIQQAVSQQPDLIVLDLMLPGLDGLEVCRRLKINPKTATIPIIMATAKGEESDIVAGLELGADDYITKPFSPKVLVARVRTVLRRRSEKTPTNNDIIQTQEITIDPIRHEVRVHEEVIELTYTEFRILQTLAKRPGQVFTRYQIVDAIHGEDYAVTDRAVDVQIAGLRKKLGPAGIYVETVRGVGYRFKG